MREFCQFLSITNPIVYSGYGKINIGLFQGPIDPTMSQTSTQSPLITCPLQAPTITKEVTLFLGFSWNQHQFTSRFQQTLENLIVSFFFPLYSYPCTWP